MAEPVARERWRGLGMAAVAALMACAPATDTPTPRPIVIHSGARLSAAPDRMLATDAWVRSTMEIIQEDPTFLIVTLSVPEIVYPWDGLEIEGDTARVAVNGTAVDAGTPYQVYAHLHLMSEMGRLDEFLLGSQGLEGFALERAILSQVSDVWLYGRTVFDATAHLPLEELIYSTENGYLDAFILTARPDEFPEERERWLKAIPDGETQYESWFQQVFQDQPPGLRPPPPVVAPDEEAPADSAAASDTTGVGR